MTDIREIAKRVIAGNIQDGDALALAEYVERIEEANKQAELRRLQKIQDDLEVNAFMWGVEQPSDEQQ